jgi:uncharacterized protein YraI
MNDLDIQEYEQFLQERANVTDEEIEARFGIPAIECARLHTDYCTQNPGWSHPNYNGQDGWITARPETTHNAR